MQRIWIIFLLLLISTLFFQSTILPVQGGEFREWLDKSDGSHYQQLEFLLQDPKGDAFLIRKLDQVPMKLIRTLLKLENYNSKDSHYSDVDSNEVTVVSDTTQSTVVTAIEQQISEPAEETFHQSIEFDIGRKVPINVERLLNACRQEIQKFPQYTPEQGQEHQWSEETAKYLRFGFWDRLGEFATRERQDFPVPLLMSSKLFLCLACGYTSRYMITAKEEQLRTKLMSYPDKTVRLIDAFRESYVLNQGNLYLTMLTLENVLAGNPYVEDRQNQPLQKKLVYLRNDSEKVGDNYGAWYHFHGIALYGFVRSGAVARAVAEIESIGSIFLEGFDKQEDFINRYGARYGKKLRLMLENHDCWNPVHPFERMDYMTQYEYTVEEDESREQYTELMGKDVPAELKPIFEKCRKDYLDWQKKEDSWLSFMPSWGTQKRLQFIDSFIKYEKARERYELRAAGVPKGQQNRLLFLNEKRWSEYRKYEHTSSWNIVKKAERKAKSHLAARVYSFSSQKHRNVKNAQNSTPDTQINDDYSVQEFEKELLRAASLPDQRAWWKKILNPSESFYRTAFRDAVAGELTLLKVIQRTAPSSQLANRQGKNGQKLMEQTGGTTAVSLLGQGNKRKFTPPKEMAEARNQMEKAYRQYVELLARPEGNQPSAEEMQEVIQRYCYYRDCLETLQMDSTSGTK